MKPNRMLLALFGIVLLSAATKVSAQAPCYVFVENSASYEKLVVSSIALTMIRQFIDAKVQPAPVSGFSDQSCIYQVNIVEESEGLKAFLLGQNISDYGTSNLRGEPGLEQAILRAIFKGVEEGPKRSAICQKYGKRLEAECQGSAGVQQDPSPSRLSQGPTPTSGGSTGMTSYRHPSPYFTVQYPAHWQVTSNDRNPQAVFIATEPNRRAPAIEISVNKTPRRPLNEQTIKRLITNLWEKRSNDAHSLKILRTEPLKYADGTTAIVCDFNINPDKARPIRLFVSLLAAEKEDSLVIVQLWAPESPQITELAKTVMASIRFD